MVPFKPEPDEEQAQVDAAAELSEIIRQLAEMDPLEYDRVRHAKAAELGVRVETLDITVKIARRMHPKQQPPPQPDPNDPESRLRPILETEGILDLWLQDLGQGDGWRASQCEAALSHRHQPPVRQVHACRHQGSVERRQESKSESRCWSSSRPRTSITFTTMSREGAALSRGRLLSQNTVDGRGERLPGAGVARHAPARTDERGKARSIRVAQKINGQIVTITIVKNGPVCFMVTTTKAALHPENETRMLSLEIDDSEEQTRRVLKKLAQTARQEHQARRRASITTGRTSSACCASSAIRTSTVPFADALAALIPPRATRLRRDFPQIIACIKAHALIHCYRRDNNERGELVADLELDYVPVAELIGHIVAEGAGIAVSRSCWRPSTR